MPTSLERFGEWYAWMLAERIEDSQTVRDVLATIRRPRPPIGFPERLWPGPRHLAARFGWLATVGTLPLEVRQQLGIPWSTIDAIELDVLACAYRGSRPIPASWYRLRPAREAFKRVAAGSGT
jgi:uncharacterized protein (DUF2236 family)